MELDNENNRTVFLRESDPFMPILPSPERQEEFLEEGLKTPPLLYIFPLGSVPQYGIG